MAPLDTHFIFNCSKVYYNSPAINTTSARSLDFESMENKRVFFECVFSVYGAVMLCVIPFIPYINTLMGVSKQGLKMRTVQKLNRRIFDPVQVCHLFAH